MRAATSEQKRRGLGDGDEPSRSVEHLWYDARHGFKCSDNVISAVLYLQYPQSDYVDNHRRNRMEDF